MNFLRYWFPVVMIAAIIFGLSSIPGDGLPPMPFWKDYLPAWIANHLDKIAHGLIYACFGWLCLRAFAGGSRVRFPKAAVIAFLMVSAYGISDEWHQQFVPHRSCEFADWAADSVGCMLAISILYRPYVRKRRRREARVDP